MKKQILSISAVALTAATLWAASARLDFFNKAGEFFSILESDLVSIAYIQADENNPESGFDKVKITTADGERLLNMADYSKIVYSPATGLEPFAIEVRNDAHSTVTMLDCVNNDGIIDPDKPHDWHGAESDYLGHLIYKPEYGYDMTVEISGQWTGKVYTEDRNFLFFVAAEDYAKWTDSWGFMMPNEPIFIDGKSTELTTYAGRDFVGEYKGFEIRKSPTLYTTTNTEMSLDLRANGSYVVKSTDANAFDFHYMYIYDDNNDAISHVRVEQPKWDYSHYYGASGPFLGDGFIYLAVNDYTSNDANDRRFYLAAKDKFTQTCAVGESAKEHLIEAVTEGGKVKYVYVNNYGAVARVAEMSFIKGSRIGENCEAIISYDGETRLKFYNDGNSNARFVPKGLEAGTYQPNDGIGVDALELDGFGGATIGGVSHTYVVESGVVTLENGRVFNIDRSDNTYKEVFSNDEWTGPVEFSIENGKGAYRNVENNKCHATVMFNQDLNGNDRLGYLALKIDTWDSGYGTTRNLISANPKYIYDKEKGTVTLSGILVGNAEGGSHYRNIVLKVADDLRSIWFDETANGEKIYGVSSAADYFYTGVQNTLVAPADVPEVKGTYTASFPDMYYVGSPMGYPGCTGSIAIDKGYSNVDKPGYAYIKIDMNIMGDVVEYQIVGSKLILKAVPVGDYNTGVNTDTDLEFQITPEGNLKGSGIVYGNAPSSYFYGVDLGSVEFTPAN